MTASKYVIPPSSQLGTRSQALRSGNNASYAKTSGQQAVLAPAPAPAPAAAMVPEASPAESSPEGTLPLIKDMETRWDARFARMETAIRSGLTNPSGASGPPTVSTAVLPGPGAAAPAPAAVIDTKKKSSRSSKSTKKKVRERSPSPGSVSSDGSDHSDNSSSSSESESEEEEETKKKTKKKKKGKYDTSKLLDEGDKIYSFERLILANLRMAVKLLKMERNIKGLLQHLVMVTEKAEKVTFASDSLCKYDEAVHATASEKGFRSYGRIDPVTIFKFLTYDGTVAAERAKRAAETNKKQARGCSGPLYDCYAYNNTSEGCKGNGGFRHICSSCGAQNHLIGECPTRKPWTGR